MTPISWTASAPTMRLTTSSGVVSLAISSPTLRPRRITTMRSDTAKTSCMLWLMMTTGTP